MKSALPRPSCHRAFTLIELMTVIAIISILAAIIIPTVGKVRKSARRAECISNLRQIMTAAHLFANEHKGNFPTTRNVAMGMFAPNPSTPHDGGLITALLSYANGSKKIFYCPSVVSPTGFTFAGQAAKTGAEGTSSGPYWNIGYYWNITIETTVLSSTPSPLPQTQSGDPRRQIASCFYQGGTLPHDGRLNTVYADGHVIAVNKSLDYLIDPATLLPKK
ncbi:prepilin-type N-terminal cleavage/methylation domain-containing protein [Opitutaceae bacterium TAV4]|nr:prepilin-type N-terminal cleavage/methylation domain-containing protein [Opitutaceae bacterium TAV4]RRJ99045.1 prepilin-type N-terminal cleavage/methylation domain-containing protein [Opitutaceae bacterium TAV3]